MNDELLEMIKLDYIKYAKMIKQDYTKVSIDYLLNEYVKALDNDLKGQQSVFFSALMLRFWYMIRKLAFENKNLHLELLDFHDWLVDSIILACKYRGWQKKEKHLTGTQAINQCITTIRVRYYYQINLNKNKVAQEIKNNLSLDDYLAADSETTYLDSLEDPSQNFIAELEAQNILDQALSENKIIETIILDCLKDTDCTRTIKVKHKATETKPAYISYKTELWRHKVIEVLNELPKNYVKYFSQVYQVKPKLVKAALNVLSAAPNTKKYKYLDSALNVLKSYY